MLLIPLFTVMALEATRDGFHEYVFALQALNHWFCGAFFLEWLVGLLAAARKKEFLLSVSNALDLLSSIPFGYLFQGMRVARLVRIARVIRIVLRARRLKGKGAKLIRVLGVVSATVFAGGLGLRIVEPETVTGLSDALWWSIVTVSTVGYGDIAPTTDLGRVVASVLVFVGIGVFGYIAGFMTSLMEDPEEDEILETVKRLEMKLDSIAEAGPQRVQAG